MCDRSAARSQSVAADTSRFASLACPPPPAASGAGSPVAAGAAGGDAAAAAVAVESDGVAVVVAGYDEDAAVAASVGSFVESAAVATWLHGDSTFVAPDSLVGHQRPRPHRRRFRHSQTPDVLPHPCRGVIL